MEKQILLDQLNDRIKRALALIVYLYPKLKDHELEEEEVNGILEITDGLKCLLNVYVDVEYNNNIESYKDNIYGIAYKEFME